MRLVSQDITFDEHVRTLTREAKAQDEAHGKHSRELVNLREAAKLADSDSDALKVCGG